MAYTWGAVNTDYLSYAGSFNAGNSNTHLMVIGWFNPSTLTATRGLWSFGTIVGLEIDATTSELRLRSDNTTDGQWTTTGVNLTVGEWVFIAVMGSFTNTGPSAAWRVWVGTAIQPPTEVTVTQAVAPSGNFTGNGTFFIGNKGAGTLAFEGDIGWVLQMKGNTGTDAFFIASPGTITAAEAELALKRYVYPAWLGDLKPLRLHPDLGSALTHADAQFWDGMSDTIIQIPQSGATADLTNGRVVTLSGPTISQGRPPVTPVQSRLGTNWAHSGWFG